MLTLVGSDSRADSLVKRALDACDPEDRATLGRRLLTGTYSALLVTLISYFEVEELDPVQVSS